MLHIFLSVRSMGRWQSTGLTEGRPRRLPSVGFATRPRFARFPSPLLRNREDIDAMQVDGYAGWIGLAVVIIGIVGGLWGRWRKK